MSKIGIVGFGYWGPIILKKIFEINSNLVKLVVDIRTDRLKKLKQRYPSLEVSDSLDTLWRDKEIEAVIIATPAPSHFEIAKKALLYNKHVLIEKPMTTSTRDARILIELSKKKRRVLMVDHTILYTDSVRKIKRYADSGKLGNIRFFDATRINLGLFHTDVNVLWDLGAHDIAVLNHLVKESPESVQAIGVSHTHNEIENIANLTIRYKSGLLAHLNCSWSSPVKIRNIIIGGDKKMIFYDEIEPTEKIKLYDRGYDLKKEKKQILFNYRTGNVFIPKIEINDAVIDMIGDFLKAVKNKKQPISDSNLGLQVVEILELAQRSIKQRGAEVLYRRNTK